MTKTVIHLVPPLTNRATSSTQPPTVLQMVSLQTLAHTTDIWRYIVHICLKSTRGLNKMYSDCNTCFRPWPGSVSLSVSLVLSHPIPACRSSYCLVQRPWKHVPTFFCLKSSLISRRLAFFSSAASLERHDLSITGTVSRHSLLGDPVWLPTGSDWNGTCPTHMLVVIHCVSSLECKFRDSEDLMHHGCSLPRAYNGARQRRHGSIFVKISGQPTNHQNKLTAWHKPCTSFFILLLQINF